MTTPNPAPPFPMGTLEGLLMGAISKQVCSSWDEANIDALKALNVGQTKPLAALLSSHKPIHPEIRLLIAEVLNPEGKTAWSLKFNRRPKRPAVDDIEIGAAVIALTQTGIKVEAAVAEVMHRTSLGRSKVYNAYSHLNKALKRIQSEADRP